MSDQYVLEPLLVGKFPAFPLNKFLLGLDSDETVPAPCIAWLARSTSSERMILVDTGPPAPTQETAKIHVGLEVTDDHRIDNVLLQSGVDPREITDIVFTHLHFDHCSYAEQLPNARILVQKTELQYAVSPDPGQRIGYETGFKSIIPRWMHAFDKIEVIQGDVEVAPGFRVLALPGHTPGSSGAVFGTRTGRFAVVGDLVNQIENWEGNNGNHIPPTLNSGVEDCVRSFKRLEANADTVLASHDYRMFDKAKYGS